MFIATIHVALRPAILDVQGKAVEQALHTLGYDSIGGVRMGKSITMDINTQDEAVAKRIVEETCAKLLANPVMENFHYRLERTTNGSV